MWDLLYEEYRTADASFVEAATLAELVGLLEGVDAERALAELERFNASVRSGAAFDPTRKDGRATEGSVPDTRPELYFSRQASEAIPYEYRIR